MALNFVNNYKNSWNALLSQENILIKNIDNKKKSLSKSIIENFNKITPTEHTSKNINKIQTNRTFINNKSKELYNLLIDSDFKINNVKKSTPLLEFIKKIDILSDENLLKKVYTILRIIKNNNNSNKIDYIMLDRCKKIIKLLYFSPNNLKPSSTELKKLLPNNTNLTYNASKYKVVKNPIIDTEYYFFKLIDGKFIKSKLLFHFKGNKLSYVPRGPGNSVSPSSNNTFTMLDPNNNKKSFKINTIYERISI